MDRVDIAIIGTGPAGLSAALNAKIRNKTFILFGSNNFSNKVFRAEKINNYLGLPGISGRELSENFKKHIESLDIDITEERVNNVYAMGEYYSIMASDNKMYEATSIILATGVEFNRALEGEENFLGRGVSYCVTCDALLYRNKDVAIVSYNQEGEEEANFLSEIAKQVYYIPLYDGEYSLNNNIKIIKDKPLRVTGEEKVKSLIMTETELEVDGVFFIKDSIAPNQLVPGLEVDGEHIVVDKNMATNLKGCFAAGDCIGKPYQYIKAAGEGNIAALNAVKYLSNHQTK
ncbi:NAD(P)/FAD-dependent oxidoreductase [Clostridium sp. MSJ-8]|uniref:NAD(P)/FAD-dependent oxidoreductase n=1 Tax=Clostridium sp. MSJ-8 TaxID=2841510 RepID=UPI001C0F2A22|nr:NAD(P)/FAD-dependent oxidoreductase [Clostridium sp. MSJ-8]MBU5487197.1 NAD(P)/FAD-dependent oxidoreductase [Clostridium sp. MSJ-8]